MTDLDSIPRDTRSTPIAEPTLDTTPTPTAKKRKRNPPNQQLVQFSIRHPTWAYIRLRHLTPQGSQQDLDGVTAHLHLTSAAQAFLGLHGAAISIDVLKLEGRDVWIRVPAEDRAAVIAAAGGWVSRSGEGWSVQGWSHWSANAAGRDAGQGLFHD